MSTVHGSPSKSGNAQARSVKVPTHLSLSGDVILGSASTVDNTHTIEALLIDITNTIRRLELTIWARDMVESGAYILSNCTFTTSKGKGLCIQAPDGYCLRRIPEEFDGSDPSNSSLPPAVPVVNFVAVVKWLDAERKRARLVGRQYMGKKDGTVDFEIIGTFEALPRWENWFFPSVGSLISGDGLFQRLDDSDTVEVVMRRCTLICEAPIAVQQALGIGNNSPNGKADALLKAHQLLQKHKQKQHQPKNGEDSDDSGAASMSPVSTGGPSDTKQKGRSVDDPADGVFTKLVSTTPHTSDGVTEPLISPTPGLLTRKRARNE
ncbi:hypothetical protein OC835_005357 [Tilletia horrida]|uniref:Uncharacterized protein n=1 Tax=Tilletia horrida TaxID=155126 RepID=A0AAN6JHL7_9BASI|nr:hypothetical protein OC842_006508 [Tilletia horrida]KAK0526239.1 hypothetical protein OC835_005357 [Tilletia horrida]